jgi:uncharacterized membrane protein
MTTRLALFPSTLYANRGRRRRFDSLGGGAFDIGRDIFVFVLFLFVVIFIFIFIIFSILWIWCISIPAVVNSGQNSLPRDRLIGAQ